MNEPPYGTPQPTGSYVAMTLSREKKSSEA